MKMDRKISLYFFLFVFILGCSKPPLFKETRILMDTFAEVSFFSYDKEAASQAMKEAFVEIERIEKLFSKFDEKSELSNVNALAGIEEVRVSPELFKIIENSLYYSRLSEGNFDITVAPLVDIWSAARKNGSIPDDTLIKAALEHAGYENIILDKGASSVHFLDREAKIDLGAIAKGFAVDRAKEILFSHRIKNALINIGGNIYALGSPPGKKSWQIGIRHPRNKSEIIYRLNLKDKAISTSGDYERFFILNGKRFSHIVNPVTGRPSEGIISVTVVADSAEASDALSTAVFVMGPEDGSELVNSLKTIEIFIFEESGKLVKYP